MQKKQKQKVLFLANKRIPILFCLLVFLFLSDGLVSREISELYISDNTAHHSVFFDSKGYTDIVHFKDKFIAVGVDGRIDCITKSGESAPLDSSYSYKLNCAYSNEEIMITAGDHGTILYSSDGEHFRKTKSGTDKGIYGITFKNGLFIAGSDNGTILISKNGIFWNIMATGAEGNIVSLSSNNSYFIGVTNAGEIIKSPDGKKWEIKDYNKEYAGYNEYSKFKKILATQNSIVIIGTHNDGSPSILFSSLGNVWAERLPVYHDDDEVVRYLTQEPNDIIYDLDRDQFILACNNGGLFILPGCSKCNKYLKISETDLKALTYSDNCLFIVGAQFSKFIQKL